MADADHRIARAVAVIAKQMMDRPLTLEMLGYKVAPKLCDNCKTELPPHSDGQ
jgi:hypothetical protein